MEVAQLGERKLVELLTKNLYKGRAVVGAGEDDAAVVEVGGRWVVLTSDIMFESTHFPKGMKPESIGRKAAVANLSDIAAMGAKPVAMLFSFGVPPRFEFASFRSMMKSINRTCEEHSAAFVGGDTKKSDELTICGMGVGEVGRGRALRRCNARVGDVVAVTGEIGNAAAGLRVIEEGIKGYGKLADAFLNPKARVREGMALSGYAGAGMDVTDGLLFSAEEIARMSGVCMSIERKKIPISKEAREFVAEHELDEFFLLNGGEDYELLVTINKKIFKKARERVERVGGRLIEIGRVVEGRGVLLDGERVKAEGYDSFAQFKQKYF